MVRRHGSRPQTALKPEMRFEWKIPQWSNAIERDRALHFVNKALEHIRKGHTKTFEPFTVPEEAIGCG